MTKTDKPIYKTFFSSFFYAKKHLHIYNAGVRLSKNLKSDSINDFLRV